MPYAQGDFNQEDNWKVYEAIITGGGGGGTATSTDELQDFQIAQVTAGSGKDSVFKTNADESTFNDSSGSSWLEKITDKTDQTALAVSELTLIKTTTACNTFSNASASTLQALIQTFLQGSPNLKILNMSYVFNSGGGGSFTCFLTYNV